MYHKQIEKVNLTLDMVNLRERYLARNFKQYFGKAGLEPGREAEAKEKGLGNPVHRGGS